MATGSRIPWQEPAPPVMPLRTCDIGAERVGRAAARLAAAAGRGLPVLPGFVVTAGAVTRLAGARQDVRGVLGAVRTPWAALARRGFPAVTVCQSWLPGGTVARTAICTSWTELVGAVLELANGERATRAAPAGGSRSGQSGQAGSPDGEGGAASPEGRRVGTDADAGSDVGTGTNTGPDVRAGGEHDLALVVQARPAAFLRGAAFSRDPFSGRRRFVVSAVGTHEPRWLRRDLRVLVRATARLHGCPQDIDWLLDTAERVWLVGSRDLLTGAPEKVFA